jgi:RNA polymerase sigma-70 factor (ECF subfamily)
VSNNDLAELAQKDKSYFNELFDRLVDRVYRFFYFKTQSHQDSEDFTSETMIKIYEKLDQYQSKNGNFDSWVFTVANNLFIDHLRKNGKAEVPIEVVENEEQYASEETLEKLDQKLLSEEIWQKVNKLPEKAKTVWGLKLTSDLAHSEIAKIMQIKESYVNVIIYRSIKQLKNSLKHLEND